MNQMTDSRVDALFDGFRVSCQDCMWNKEEITNQNCKDCFNDNKSALRKLLIESLPKKKRRDKYGEEYGEGICDGYNQVLDDVKKRIEEMLL